MAIKYQLKLYQAEKGTDTRWLATYGDIFETNATEEELVAAVREIGQRFTAPAQDEESADAPPPE